jgi:hypothetical protein
MSLGDKLAVIQHRANRIGRLTTAAEAGARDEIIAVAEFIIEVAKTISDEENSEGP